MDLAIIKVIIISLDASNLQSSKDKANFNEYFAQIVVNAFMAELKLRDIDAPLKNGEKPDEFICDAKFTIDPEYFKHPKYALPCILKKFSKETEDVHRERVKKFLLCIDDVSFTQFGYLYDDSKPNQKAFRDLIIDCTDVRLENAMA